MEPSGRVVGTKDKPNGDGQPLVLDVSKCCHYIWMISTTVKSRVDVVLIHENLRGGVADAEALDVHPMTPLSECIVYARNLLRVDALHLVMEGAGIVRIVNVSRKVHYNLSFTFT